MIYLKQYQQKNDMIVTPHQIIRLAYVSESDKQKLRRFGGSPSETQHI